MHTQQTAALVELLRTEYTTKHAPLRDLLLEGKTPLEILGSQAKPDTFTLMKTWCDNDFQFVTIVDAEYPRQLRDVHDAPLIIFYRGTLMPDDRGVCIVGSRECTDGEATAAAEVSAELVQSGLTVVSGLAGGIDSAAHQAAISHGGRTVAVIGTGLAHSYPKSSSVLQQEISRQGLVISQFWPDFVGAHYSFPMRNAVMSAYGRCTIIIAAGEKSGTRHQARQAIRHGRPLVLTQRVASQTSWGRDIVQKGSDVTVVSSATEAVNAAVEYVDRRLPELLLQ